MNILLTGAGFTKNFGGLLASEMWSKIFNHPQIQSQPRLRKLLLHDYDYESIYYKVINGPYEESEKNIISETILETYKILDEIIRTWMFTNDSPYPVNKYEVNKFIESFNYIKEEISFFFTLNQDLFIERHFHSINTQLLYPGIIKLPGAEKIKSGLPIEQKDYITLPTEDKIASNSFFKHSIHYIKLHGSFGWKSINGNNRLVIGRNKETQISEEPLLSWYFEVFKKTLCKKDVRLFIIGYSFHDSHVNEVIANAINEYKLRLYVLSPKKQYKFIKELCEVSHGEKILSGLVGYFPYSLLELFPADQTESHGWKEIKERYFELKCIY